VLLSIRAKGKKEGTMVNHKPDNYDRDYKGPTFLIDCWGSGGYLYEPDATECDQKISLFTC
jgi:hypothetical protein